MKESKLMSKKRRSKYSTAGSFIMSPTKINIKPKNINETKKIKFADEVINN